MSAPRRANGVRALVAATALVPWVVALLRAALPLGGAGIALHHAFALVCHQIPERTIALASVPMPVCSRCAGIYAGVAVAALAPSPRMSVRALRIALAIACVPMLIDVVTQELGLHPPWHAARLATGFLVGAVATALFFARIER